MKPPGPLSLAVVLFALFSPPASGQNPTEGAPITAKKFTLISRSIAVKSFIAELAKQTALEVDIAGIDGEKTIAADFNEADFWVALNRLAEATGSRVVIGQRGKAVRLVKATTDNRPPVFVDGPFRIAAKEVEAHLDLQTGKTGYDLTLEIAWEARLPVYRIDATPRNVKGTDDAGRAIEIMPLDARNPVDGVSTTARIRLNGLTRDSKRIAELKGTFRATVAEEMLRFEADDLTKPAVVKQKGVDLVLRKFAKEGTFWVADLALRYPANGAVFESFEVYWLSRNRIALIAPDGTKHATLNEEIDGNAIRYRFKEDRSKGFAPMSAKGWKLEYETPGPLREVSVRFELKGVGLP